MFTGDFKLPSYYKSFSCKGNECKNVCCSMWNITLTEDEYFNVMNLNTSPSLKEKIDAYIGILNHPTSDKFARINLDYNGICPLRLENGYCGLQCECGESKIPSVCRYYPRSPRLFPLKECVISSSCEKTIELLIEDDSPFIFENRELSFYFDAKEDEKYENNENLILRDRCIELLKDRNKIIFDRIIEILNFINPKFKIDEEKDKKIYEEIKNVYARSLSINTYLYNTKNIISLKESIALLEKFYPLLSIWMEKILINHIFYMKFPYVASSIKKEDSVYGLYYLILISLNFVLNNEKKEKDDFVAITCNAFRLYEHSPFYYNMAYLVNKLAK